MKNREKFAQQIIDIALSGGGLAVVNGEPKPCFEAGCRNCDFPRNDCEGKVKAWGEQEYEGDKKLIEAVTMLKEHCRGADCHQCIFSNGVLCELSEYAPQAWNI